MPEAWNTTWLLYSDPQRISLAHDDILGKSETGSLIMVLQQLGEPILCLVLRKNISEQRQ